jgi:alpha-1,6-mannosyltransferase
MIRFITRNKLWVLGLLSAVIYGMNLRIADVLVQLEILDSVPDPIASYLMQIAPLSLIYFLAVWMTARGQDAGKTLTPIVLFALLFRLPLIPLDPALSSDVYRYLWEGKVQVVAAMNPYIVPPADDRLAFLRDQAIYPHINRKEAPTIYPAGAQLLFALLHKAGVESPQAFKVFSLAADALTLLLLFLILKQLQLPFDRVIIYAWNPLLIYEFFWSGHLESLMLPPLLGFIYLFLRGRVLAAGAALGLVTAIKLVPIFLLATVPQGKRLKTVIPFVFVVGVTYLFYAEAGTRILGFLPTYFSDPYEIFNLGIVQLGFFWVAQLFSFPVSWVRLILFALLLGSLMMISRRPSNSPADFIEKSYATFSVYLLLIYPAFHPWYLCILMPLLCLVSSRAWILFSLLLPVSYLKYLTPDGTMPLWITLAQFVPLYLLLIWEQGKFPIPLRERHSSGGALNEQRGREREPSVELKDRLPFGERDQTKESLAVGPLKIASFTTRQNSK